jgi:hypothetical protein
LSLGNTAGNSSISGVNNLSATSITTPTLANGSNTLTIGTVGQITNIVGTLQNNGAELPAYISSAGVASGSIDMNSNFLTEVGGLDASGVLAIGQAQASLGVSIGRATQTTNLNGNVQFNSSSGTSGQVLTSTGATTAPTFQTLAVNTTYYQTIDTSVTTGGGSSLRAKLTFNVPTSTATYLFSFSAIGGPDNASGVGGQTFTTFTYEKGTSTSFTGSRNMIGNAIANVALTNQTSVSAVVNGPTGTYNALSGQRIYTVSTGTAFVAGDYSFCLLVYNVGPANVRQMTFSAIQLTA